MADQTTNLFLTLTPERVLDAVEAAELRCNPVCYPLNSFENRVYEVELDDGSRMIAKFYRPGRWDEGAILEEHRFLADLAAAELPVCPVRPFPDGGTLHQIDGIWYSIADRRAGRAPDELDDALAERLGMLVGRMHAVGASRPADSRPRLDGDRYARRNVDWLLAAGALPGGLRDRYTTAALTLADIADRRMQGIAVHRIHADLHLGNALLRDGVLRLLDFDDMVTGPAVQDLWLALPGRDADTLRRRTLFIEGYERFRAFDRSTLNLIEPLRGLRLVRYAAWLARRWHDPAFKIGWPQFGTEEYWTEQTEDLESILGVIAEGRELSAPIEVAGTVDEEGALLSNQDYFWDWEK